MYDQHACVVMCPEADHVGAVKYKPPMAFARGLGVLVPCGQLGKRREATLQHLDLLCGIINRENNTLQKQGLVCLESTHVMMWQLGWS